MKEEGEEKRADGGRGERREGKEGDEEIACYFKSRKES